MRIAFARLPFFVFFVSALLGASAYAIDTCREDGPPGTAECRPPIEYPFYYKFVPNTGACPGYEGPYDSEDAAKDAAVAWLKCAAPNVCSYTPTTESDWVLDGSYLGRPTSYKKTLHYNTLAYRSDTVPCTQQGDGGAMIRKLRDVRCEQGFDADSLGNRCMRHFAPPDPAVCSVGNPIHPGDGAKLQTETDYAGSGSNGLRLVRYYYSYGHATRDAGRPIDSTGHYWRINYDRTITVTSGTKVTLAYVDRPDGQVKTFTFNGTDWIARTDDPDRLTQLKDGTGAVTGWRYTNGDDDVEMYDANGKLVSLQNRKGLVQTLTYSDETTPTSIASTPGLLIRVTDSYGSQLNFQYDSTNRLIKAIDPANREYLYGYDGASSYVVSGGSLLPPRNLTSVVYPDGKKRIYHYNEQANTGNNNLPYALTGITDENQKRLSVYKYYSNGQAYSTEYAGGVNKFTVNAPQGVTDPLGTVRGYSWQKIDGMNKSAGQNQPAGAGCSSASNGISYDANGNLASRRDFNGNTTTYSYDLARNLEIKRVEASGKPQARTITTEWHPTYRLPTRIAEPKRITVNSYDDKGNLLSKSVQATSDTNGSQGFAAATVGSARGWRYTYNSAGQVLTATGPRTDVNDTMTYAYDDMGNLVTVTNATGQITTLSNYDANGRVGKITDPNGLVTILAYSPRGWLTSRSVGGEVTNYDYDGVGQLTKVTQPDGSYISYTYDDAHRLTSMTDSAGNRIVYTLDAMGNRTKETVQDPSGALAQQTTRVYDALNRLQQITGGMQ